MAELVNLAQNFMNAEDAIIAKKRKRAEKMEANPTCHFEQGPHPKKERTIDKKDRDNKKAGPSARNQQYTRHENGFKLHFPKTTHGQGVN